MSGESVLFNDSICPSLFDYLQTMQARAIDMPVRKTLEGSANILICRRIGLTMASGQTSFRTKSDRCGCQSLTFLCFDRSGSTHDGFKAWLDHWCQFFGGQSIGVAYSAYP